MRIVFVGESDSRNIVIPGGLIPAIKGIPVDVPDEVAKSLLEQDIYEPAPADNPEPAPAVDPQEEQ